MIYHKYKCIFIHIPKTGGSTIEAIFRDNGAPYVYADKHLRCKRAKRRYLKHWRFYYKFAFVRNPWDRVYSIWYNKYRSEYKLRRFLRNIKTINDISLYSQHRWLYHVGKLGVDFVGRFENFEEDLDFIVKKFGLNVETLPNIKKIDGKPHYTEFYNKETIALVKKIYKRDVSTWGYKYGE